MNARRAIISNVGMGAISGIVLLVGIAGITIWLLWSAFRANHWAWGWRTLAGVVGTFLLLFLLVVAQSIRHAIEYAKARPGIACFVNVNQIGKALMMYTGANDERMPPREWTESIIGYVGSRDVYICPALGQPYGYTMSEIVVGLDITAVDPARTVSIFDGPGGKDSVGGVEKIRYRHNGGHTTLGFLDGHARRVSRKETPPLLPANSR